MTEASRTVSCPTCGESRPPELAATAQRPPCPRCGEQSIAISLVLADEFTVAEAVSVGLRPAEQTRGWRRRWAEIQRNLSDLDTPRTNEFSGDSVHAALHELQSFYVQAYHMKDALREEGPALGISARTIETAVTNDPDLALLADLANLDKHFKLNKPPGVAMFRCSTCRAYVPVLGKADGGFGSRLRTKDASWTESRWRDESSMLGESISTVGV